VYEPIQGGLKSIHSSIINKFMRVKARQLDRFFVKLKCQ